METHLKYLKKLYAIAAQKEKAGKARLAACIVYKHRIVAVGENSWKTSPFQLKYGSTKESIYCHAETITIARAMKYLSVEQLKKSTLYICRVKKDEDRKNLIFGLSKPCIGCEKCIAAFDIKRVIYTLDGLGNYDFL